MVEIRQKDCLEVCSECQTPSLTQHSQAPLPSLAEAYFYSPESMEWRVSGLGEHSSEQRYCSKNRLGESFPTEYCDCQSSSFNKLKEARQPGFISCKQEKESEPSDLKKQPGLNYNEDQSPQAPLRCTKLSSSLLGPHSQKGLRKKNTLVQDYHQKQRRKQRNSTCRKKETLGKKRIYNTVSNVRYISLYA